MLNKKPVVRFHYPLEVAKSDVEYIAATRFKGYVIITPGTEFHKLDQVSQITTKLALAEEQIVKYTRDKAPIHMLIPAYKYRDMLQAQKNKQWKQASKNTKSTNVDVHVVIVKDILEYNPDHNVKYNEMMNTLNIFINNHNVKVLYLVDSMSLKAVKVTTIKTESEVPDYTLINQYRKDAIAQLQAAVQYEKHSEDTFTSFSSIYYDIPSTDIPLVKASERPYFLKDKYGQIVKDSSGSPTLLGYYSNLKTYYVKAVTHTDYLSFQYYAQHGMLQELDNIPEEVTDPVKFSNLSTAHTHYKIYKGSKLFGLDQDPDLELEYLSESEDEDEELDSDATDTPVAQFIEYEAEGTFTSYDQFIPEYQQNDFEKLESLMQSPPQYSYEDPKSSYKLFQVVSVQELNDVNQKIYTLLKEMEHNYQANRHLLPLVKKLRDKQNRLMDALTTKELKTPDKQPLYAYNK